MESLYGAFGNPTAEDRARLYASQQATLRGQIGRAQDDARRQAMGAAVSATSGGNPFLAGRLGAHAAGDASQRVQSAGVAALGQQGATQQAQEIQSRQQQGQWAQNAIGGLLGAGGQVLGMAVPAFGALRGAAGASGVTGALGGSGNPVGGLLGAALGGGGHAPQGAPPQTPQASSTLGAQGWFQQAQSPLGFSGSGPPGATQRLGPDGQLHWYDASGNQVG